MNYRRACGVFLSAMLFASLFVFHPAAADDWPQWLGPQRDSVWREQGIVDRYPGNGPKVLWRAEVGLGYSGPAVAEGKVYVMDYLKTSGRITNQPSARDKLEGTERIVCFDASNGKLLWKHEYPQPYHISYPSGPRATPTVAAGKVYALGAEGVLTCLDAETGDVVWKKNLNRDYDTSTPLWGHSAHPLVDGDFLYCIVGGAGSVAVAFNNDTGKEVWRAVTAETQGYCPPTMIEHAGVKQLLIWDPAKLNSLNPKSGEVYWTVKIKPAYGMSITVPRKHGELLYVSGIGNESVLLKLASDKPGAEVLWRGTAKSSVYCANSTPFLEGEMIYGADCRVGALIGARLKDGERLWQTFRPTTGGDRRAGHGTAFIVKQADRYFLASETGDLVIARLSKEGYEELDRTRLIAPTNEAFGRKVVWSHPAFALRSVFARNDKVLVRVSLAAE